MRTYFLLAYLWLLRLLESVKQEGLRLWHHLCSYHDARHWVFLEGHTLPLPRSHAMTTPAEWHYANHQLIGRTQGPLLRMGWLSAKVVVEDNEYEMDTFLADFRVQGIPPLTHVFLAWCAETRRWFPPGSATLHVIDEEGERCIYGLDRTLQISGRRLYVLESVPRSQALFDPYTYYHA